MNVFYKRQTAKFVLAMVAIVLVTLCAISLVAVLTGRTSSVVAYADDGSYETNDFLVDIQDNLASFCTLIGAAASILVAIILPIVYHCMKYRLDYAKGLRAYNKSYRIGTHIFVAKDADGEPSERIDRSMSTKDKILFEYQQKDAKYKSDIIQDDTILWNKNAIKDAISYFQKVLDSKTQTPTCRKYKSMSALMLARIYESGLMPAELDKNIIVYPKPSAWHENKYWDYYEKDANWATTRDEDKKKIIGKDMELANNIYADLCEGDRMIGYSKSATMGRIFLREALKYNKYNGTALCYLEADQDHAIKFRKAKEQDGKELLKKLSIEER